MKRKLFSFFVISTLLSLPLSSFAFGVGISCTSSREAPFKWNGQTDTQQQVNLKKLYASVTAQGPTQGEMFHDIELTCTFTILNYDGQCWGLFVTNDTGLVNPRTPDRKQVFLKYEDLKEPLQLTGDLRNNPKIKFECD